MRHDAALLYQTDVHVNVLCFQHKRVVISCSNRAQVWSPEVRVLAVVGTAKALICEIGGAAELTFRPVTWVNVAATGGAWADCGRELLLWTATSLHRLTFCAPPEEPYQSPHMSTPKEIVLGLLGRRIRFVQPVCGPYGASAHAVVVLDADTSIYTPANAGLIDYSALDRRAEGREGFASSPLERKHSQGCVRVCGCMCARVRLCISA